MDNDKISIQIAAAILMGLIFLLSQLVSNEVMMGVYFFIPIAMVSWAAGLMWGIAFSLLATVMPISLSFHAGMSITNQVNLYLNTFGFLVMFVSVAYLTSRFSEDHRKLLRISREDFLTGAMNRVGFYDMLNMEIRRQARFGHPYTLAIISCDNFKKINDSLGHTEGDELLIAVAKTLELNTRTTDVFARLGGDEFALLFPLIMRSEAASVLEKLKLKLEENMRDHRWDVTFSIAGISFDKSPESVGHALDMVDSLIHEIKTSGKNRILHTTFSSSENGQP